MRLQCWLLPDHTEEIAVSLLPTIKEHPGLRYGAYAATIEEVSQVCSALHHVCYCTTMCSNNTLCSTHIV